MNSTLAGLIAFLSVLPKLISLMARIGNAMVKNSFDSWISDLEKQIDALEKANDPKSKLDAAKGIVNSISGL